MKKTILIFVVCAACVPPVSAFQLQPFGQKEQPMIEFEGRFWNTDLEGKAEHDSHVIPTKVDLKSDLGISDEDFPEARFTWRLGPASKIRFSYTQADFSGDQVLTRTIEFNNRTYTAGSRVTTELDLRYFGLDWTWQFLNLFDVARLGSVIGIKGVEGDYSLDASSLGISDSDDFLAGLPVVGIAADVTPIPAVDVFAEFSGLYMGELGHFIDAEIGVKFLPLTFVSISAGYRILDIEAEDDPDYASIRLKGPFFAAGVRF